MDLNASHPTAPLSISALIFYQHGISTPWRTTMQRSIPLSNLVLDSCVHETTLVPCTSNAFQRKALSLRDDQRSWNENGRS
jgi:hypothetical protein